MLGSRLPSASLTQSGSPISDWKYDVPSSCVTSAPHHSDDCSATTMESRMASSSAEAKALMVSSMTTARINEKIRFMFLPFPFSTCFFPLIYLSRLLKQETV